MQFMSQAKECQSLYMECKRLCKIVRDDVISYRLHTPYLNFYEEGRKREREGESVLHEPTVG